MGGRRAWVTKLNKSFFAKPISIDSRKVVAVISALLLFVFFLYSFTPRQVSLAVGQVSDVSIKAPRELVDREETERLRQAAVAEVKEVYDSDPRVGEVVEQEVSSVLAALAELAGDDELGPEERAEAFQQAHAGFAEEAVLLAASASPEEVELAHHVAGDIVDRLMQVGIKPDALEIRREDVRQMVVNSEVTESLRALVISLIEDRLQPNMVYNEEETEHRRQVAADNVEPVLILKGQYIIRDGEIVTEQHIFLLQELGMLRTGLDARLVAAAALMSLGTVLYHGIHLHYLKPRVLQDESKIIILAVVYIGILVISGVVQHVSGYLAPIAAGTMLLATMVDPTIALASGVGLSLSLGAVAGGEFRVMAMAIIGGMAGVFAVCRLGNRYGLMRAGFVVAAANVAGLFTLSLILGTSFDRLDIWRDHTWGAINGLVSTILTIGSLPFFEGVFKIITPMKLVELANPNQPLLHRLLLEAPGTYYHSVLVGNLAEAAVEAVGGDSLLARVGAYYHDVGKCRRPYFFIENQVGSQENPHDRIAPGLSTLIITSHVRDGVEMAEEAKLPQVVIDFIREHHGTTVVSYFYNRATENGSHRENISEDDFRYDGPRPQRKETAIVMLADSVEAAVRSISKTSPGRIETLVKRIIKDRLNENQLDKCDLTLQELDVIGDTFIRVLGGIFHPRIEYPEALGHEAEPSEAPGADEEGEEQGDAGHCS